MLAGDPLAVLMLIVSSAAAPNLTASVPCGGRAGLLYCMALVLPVSRHFWLRAFSRFSTKLKQTYYQPCGFL